MGGGPGGGGGLIFMLSTLVKFWSRRNLPFFPQRLSLTYMGSPNSKSSVQTWQIFLSLLQDWHTLVLL